MSADPAYQAWRGQKLLQCAEHEADLSAGRAAACMADLMAEAILNPARPVRQPDFAALGLGSADEAAGRN